MTGLPRLLAVTTDAVCRSPAFPAGVAGIASLGPRAGILVRAPAASDAELAEFAGAAAARLSPGGARLFIHARPDLAAALGAAGVQLRRTDLSPRDARLVMPDGLIGLSVHDPEEARRAAGEGADFLVAGNVFASESHPGRPARGLAWLESIVAAGIPVFAIGGITPARQEPVLRAGAFGVAVISAIWDQPDPGDAAREFLSAGPAGPGEIELTVNGEPRRVSAPLTLAGLLERLDLDQRAVVVELNRRIVRRPDLGHTRLAEGDSVELVHFVGGG